MAKYELIANGKHVENDRIFKKGDVVESNTPLDTLFRLKFRRMPDSTNPSIGVPTPALAAKLQEQQEAMKSPEPPAPVEVMEVVSGEINSPTVHDYGTNVTDSYPEATEGGFSVFKKGLSYSVVKDGAAVNEHPLKKREVNDFLSNLLKNSD